MEAWAIFLIVAAGLVVLTLIITCCSACCLLGCLGSCSSNPLCCLAAGLLACLGLGPRESQLGPRTYYYTQQGQQQQGSYGSVPVVAAAAVVIPPPPRVVYSATAIAVPASAPPADAHAIPMATATPLGVYGQGADKEKEEEERLRLTTPASDHHQRGMAVAGGSRPDYPPAHIDTVGAGASAPPYPGGEESEDELMGGISGRGASGGGGRSVRLDVPLPPKGSEPRDLWAAVLFAVVACLLATLALRLGLPAVGVWEAELGSGSSGSGYYSDAAVATARTLLGVCVALAGAGGLLAMAWLHLMLHWSSALITSTLQATVAGAGLLALLSLTLGHLLGALFFLLLALAALRLLQQERAKVFLSSANLGLACRALLEHKALLGVAYLALLAELLWGALWTLAALGWYAHTSSSQHGGKQGSGGSYYGEGTAMVVFLAVSLYWGQQVCQNLLRCTAVGTVASWWYTPDLPRSPVLPALARAAGPSLGSVCLGSLLVSAVEGLRAVVRTLVQSRRLSCLGGCLLDWVAAWVEGLFLLANRFAFVFVGIWGYPYATAASLGIRLFQAKGWQAVLNDLLIGETLLLGSLLVGGLTASLGVYLAHLDPGAFAGLPNPAPFLALAGFFLGLGNCLALLNALGAAVDTVFVAWASDPDSLRRHRPVEYVHLLSAWRHYDDVNNRRLAAGIVVCCVEGPAPGPGHGPLDGVGVSPAVVYSQGGRHVVRVSI